MKPFTSKHCTPINYGSPLNNNKKTEKLKKKIEETRKKAFIRSNSPSEEYEESKEEKRAQRRYKRLSKRLDHTQKFL
jgi:hypothetical protein